MEIASSDGQDFHQLQKSSSFCTTSFSLLSTKCNRTDRVVRNATRTATCQPPTPSSALSSPATCPQNHRAQCVSTYICVCNFASYVGNFLTILTERAMEEGFQSQPLLALVGGEAPPASVDEAYLSGVCAGLSFRSLLTGGSFEPAAESHRDPLKMPKTEPPCIIDNGIATVPPPYNFFSEATSSSLCHQLPGLLSFELLQNSPAIEPPVLNPRVETVSYGKQRRKRQDNRLSDKTRCLQKLLPSDEKMGMATVLEEAYKYIKFLQVQVGILQLMPSQGGGGGAICSSTNIGGGDLGRLNRQQLLQVVMNSPAAQMHLYSKECCLYSVEQMILLKKNAERKALYQQMMIGSSNPNSFLP